MAKCPAHADSTPSLSIKVGDDGKLLLHCFAGCTAEDVVRAVGLTLSDLMGDGTNVRLPAAARTGWSTPQAAAEFVAAKVAGWVEAIYEYPDQFGAINFAVARFKTETGKTFRPLQRSGGSWHIGDPDRLLPLFRLPRLLTASDVLLVEGEKCVLRAEAYGLVATTSAHGAESAKKTDWIHLANKRVTMWPDNDTAGSNYIRDVLLRLRAANPDVSVRVISVEGLPPGGDIVDWADSLLSQGATEEQVAAELRRLIDTAPPWSGPNITYSTDITGRVGGSAPWPPPLPLTKATEPPPFPIDTAFPPGCARLKEFVSAVATSYQVPVDLPAMLALAAIGLAVSKKVEVAPLPDWREQLALYVLVLLQSGERKSPVFAKMIGPIRDWQRQRAMSMALEIAQSDNNIRIAKEKLNRKRSAAARGEADDGEGMSMDELLGNLKQLEDKHPAPPSMIASEATTEAISDLLAENDERGMLAAPEGDALDVMLGRYGHGKPNFGLWLSGHAGDTIEVRRKGRPTVRLQRPALTVALAVQDEAIADLITSKAAAGRGVLGRFLFSRPSSKLGYRDLQPPPIPTSASDWYGARLHQLLDRPVPDEPVLLKLEFEADRLLLAFRERVERELRPEGRFSDHQSWGAKLAGAVVRIAGVLHCVGDPELNDHLISGETMRAALAWAPYLEAHERHVAWIAGDNSTTTIAERILAWIRRERLTEFSHNECFNGVRGSLVREAQDIDAALHLLEELRWIRIRPAAPAPRRRGRPPGDRYEVNPNTHGPSPQPAPQNTQNTQYSAPAPVRPDNAAGNASSAGRLAREGDEWSTPVEIIEAAREVLGVIDLDPATNAAAQARIGATTFYTQKDDALVQPWRGRTWCNPPYSHPLVEHFVDKLVTEHGAGNVPSALLLTNSQTSAGWFHTATAAASAVCQFRGRIRFLRADGTPGKSPAHGQTLFYFGADTRRFAEVFGNYGTITVRNERGAA